MIYYSKRYFCVCQHGFLNFQWIGSSQYAGHFFIYIISVFEYFFSLFPIVLPLRLWSFIFSFNFTSLQYIISPSIFALHSPPQFPFPLCFPFLSEGQAFRLGCPREGRRVGREGVTGGGECWTSACTLGIAADHSPLVSRFKMTTSSKLAIPTGRGYGRQGGRAGGPFHLGRACLCDTPYPTTLLSVSLLYPMVG